METVFPNLICRFYTIPIKIPAAFFAEVDKVLLKFIRKYKGPSVAETVLEKEQSWRTHQFLISKCTTELQ